MRRSIILFSAIVWLLVITIKADHDDGTVNDSRSNPSLLNQVLLTRGRDKNEVPQQQKQQSPQILPAQDNEISASDFSDSSSDLAPCCGADPKSQQETIEDESETMQQNESETEEVLVDDVPLLVD